MADQAEQRARGLAPRTIVRYADERGVVEAASTRLLLRVIDLLSDGRRRVDLAVTGGSDGIEMLRLTGINPLAASVDWKRVHFWWGDERFVPADDPDRNALQARQALLSRLMADFGLPEDNIHEMPADTRDFVARQDASDEEDEQAVRSAAAAYQHEMVTQMGDHPAFDIAWFGMGPDGHFASLMPGLPGIRLDDPNMLTCGVTHSPKLPPLRVSLTVPAIQSSHEVWVIASGERKREALAKALGAPGTPADGGDFDDPDVPVTFAAGRERTLWMVDTVAAPIA
jgi:6-phosphogluconolactonase